MFLFLGFTWTWKSKPNLTEMSAAGWEGISHSVKLSNSAIAAAKKETWTHGSPISEDRQENETSHILIVSQPPAKFV